MCKPTVVYLKLTSVTVQLSKLSTLIENDGGQRVLQVQQQADSVRYLNELNSVCAIRSMISVSDIPRVEVAGKLR